MCQKVAGLDVILGGHSLTDLDNGKYQIKVIREDGSACRVVTAYGFGVSGA